MTAPLTLLHARYWHKEDVHTVLMNVRFEGNNGHDAVVTRCLHSVEFRRKAFAAQLFIT